MATIAKTRQLHPLLEEAIAWRGDDTEFSHLKRETPLILEALEEGLPVGDSLIKKAFQEARHVAADPDSVGDEAEQAISLARSLRQACKNSGRAHLVPSRDSADIPSQIAAGWLFTDGPR